MFTKYGYALIGLAAIISFLLIVISFFIQNNIIKIILVGSAAVILVFTLIFFRDPERKPPDRDDIIISPADGKIILIKKNVHNEFGGENSTLVSIFMSPLDVHVNRIPVSGKVEYLKYFEGDFLAAFDDKATGKNERMEIGINSEHGKILFAQVAGFLARRIITDLRIGDEVKIGRRFGMIRFGSRVDIFAPGNFGTAVKLNDRVKAGETILFELIK